MIPQLSGADEDAYLDAAAALLGLPIRPAHRAEALAAFRVLRQHAALVTAFPLPEEIEAAPRFSPFP
jgi:hypothetical protein